MLQRLKELPSYVAAFRATGEVSKDDYERVLVPELERVDKEHGHIHFFDAAGNTCEKFFTWCMAEGCCAGIKTFSGLEKNCHGNR